MGIHQKWWQNQVHTSGDSEKGLEGLNTVHVFAVDNVGNISLPGTARIFIDSLPPDQPTLSQTITSTNYFTGSKSTDTTDIWVNGRHEDDMEMISSTNWRYRHRLNDGELLKFTFQAVDGLKNKSKMLPVTLGFDKTPPRIFSAVHNGGGRILRAKDVITFTVRGDVSSNAFMRVGPIDRIPLYDDGTRGDQRSGDGLYTGTWVVPSELQGRLDVVASLYDAAGNRADQLAEQVQVDSLAAQNVDDFEEEGDRYPWKNRAIARNVIPERAIDPGVEAPQGKSLLKLEYDLKGQGWAGISSEEFKPRNYYGAKPYVSFWLKGSGSRSRVMVVLQGKQRRDVDFRDPQLKQASITLADTRWQRITIPVPAEFIAPLSETVKYSIYIFGDDEEDKGTLYIDDLRVTYKPEAVVRKNKSSSTAGTVPSLPLVKESGVRAEGEVIPAPYLQLELSPQPVVKGKTVAIKVVMPKNIQAVRAYAVFGTRNGEPQKAMLKSSSATVWKGEYTFPADTLSGEQFGILYVQDKNNTVFKKMFTYKAVEQNAAAYEQIVGLIDPHPAIAGKDIAVKVKVPLSVKSSQVMVFFGADQQKLYSVKLTKATSSAGEVWHGVTTIPEDMPAGNYSANVLIKTKDNRFVRTTLSYAVITPAS
jgi:hypothetical protein